MCCFKKLGRSVLWQFTQRATRSFFRRCFPLVEACGSWQLMHPFSTGLCLNFTLATALPISLWQSKQSSFPAFRRTNLFFEAWGSWHFIQFPSMTTLWLLFGFLGIIPSWHLLQILFGSSSSSFPWETV